MVSIKTIGLTGGIACGKSSVTRILAKYGAKVISADELARQVIEPGGPAYADVIKRFGKDIIKADGQIDRSMLGMAVFKDNLARQRLEDIIHPLVIAEIKKQINYWKESGERILVVEVPLLFEAGMSDLFDQIWVVSAPFDEQLERIQKRDQLNAEEAKQRISAQLPLAYKEGKADAVIYNNKEFSDLESQVQQLIKTME